MTLTPAMAIQPTFLLIADIGGYTRFMKFHRASLAHAQEMIAVAATPGAARAPLPGAPAASPETTPAARGRKRS